MSATIQRPKTRAKKEIVDFFFEENQLMVAYSDSQPYKLIEGASETEFQEFCEKKYSMEDFEETVDDYDDDGDTSKFTVVNWEYAKEEFYSFEYIERYIMHLNAKNIRM